MTLSIIRISLLLTLAATGIACLSITPTTGPGSIYWWLIIILSKVAAAVCFYGIYKLYGCWYQSDRWIAAYHRWCGRGLQDCCDNSLDKSAKCARK